MFSGVVGFIGFGLGMSSGILSLRRQLLPMVFVGLAAIILASILCLWDIEFFLVFGIAPLVLAILSVVFVAISHAEFRESERQSWKEEGVKSPLSYDSEKRPPGRNGND